MRYNAYKSITFNIRIMKNFERQIEELTTKVNDLTESLKKAKVFTTTFLDECAKVGITRVSVGLASEKVPASVNYPFSPRSSVFQFPSGTKDKSGCTAISGVVHKLGISGGCGNSDQYQIKTDADLMEGVFELKKGQWRKIS